MLDDVVRYADIIKEELMTAKNYEPVVKDIIIVVHDQLNCIYNCINSIQRNTKDYHIYLWDNASKPETADYLRSLNVAYFERSEENLGFIIPNNRLVSQGQSPYIILLNSDTVVRQGWDEVMIAWLQSHPDIAAVGCMGGLLDEQMVGSSIAKGYQIDYLCGWCLCFRRSIYDVVGLFDQQHLSFAYGEDSDFSLRLKEAGHKIYALYSGPDLVMHLQARTSMVVQHERDMIASFNQNHAYLRERWGHARLGSKPPDRRG